MRRRAFDIRWALCYAKVNLYRNENAVLPLCFGRADSRFRRCLPRASGGIFYFEEESTNMGKIILTGDRPTGRLHIGHYVGSLRRRVEL